MDLHFTPHPHNASTTLRAQQPTDEWRMMLPAPMRMLPSHVHFQTTLIRGTLQSPSAASVSFWQRRPGSSAPEEGLRRT